MDWVCYLLYCVDKNITYVGATNNFEARLKKHNNGKGAKCTARGKWVPVLFISGFASKKACLSFEKGWQIRGRRNLFRKDKLPRSKFNVANRLIDLHFFTNHTYYENEKFKFSRTNIGEYELTINLLTNIFDNDYLDQFEWFNLNY